MSGVTKLGESAKSGQASVKSLGRHDKSLPEAVSDFLLSTREEVLQLVRASPGSAIEIEARLGRCMEDGDQRLRLPTTLAAGAVLTDRQLSSRQARFVPGVSQQHYKQYGDLARRWPGVQESELNETVYTYPHCRVIHRGGRQLSQVKRRVANLNLCFPNQPYDCRISVSCEGVETEAAPASGSATSARAKARRSFVRPPAADGSNNSNTWQLDLTQVATTEMVRGVQSSRSAFEVELELVPHSAQQWGATPPPPPAAAAAAAAAAAPGTPAAAPGTKAALRTSASALTQSLLRSLHSLMPRQAEPEKLPAGSAAVAAVRAACSAATGGNRREFPGTMPASFMRRHLTRVQRRPYFVSEKTDGVRYFLVRAGGGGGGAGDATQAQIGGGVYLYDRTGSAFTLPGLPPLAAVLPRGCVLDGELVRHRGSGRYVFIVFDALSLGEAAATLPPPAAAPDGTPLRLTQCPLEHRLKAVSLAVQWYDTGMRQGSLPRHAGATLELLTKKWFPVHRICEVFARVSRGGAAAAAAAAAAAGGGAVPPTASSSHGSGGSGHRSYIDAKRHHYTDGVIFAPNTAYVYGSDPSYLKWKWADLVSIDFHVGGGGGGSGAPAAASANGGGGGDSGGGGAGLTFGVDGPDNSIIDVTRMVTLADADAARLQNDMRMSGCAAGATMVAEFAFCADTGLWTYQLLRPDKLRANYISTVLSTVMQLAEGIGEKELQYRILSGGGGGDHWDHHVRDMAEKVLAQKIRSVRKQQQAQHAPRQ